MSSRQTSELDAPSFNVNALSELLHDSLNTSADDVHSTAPRTPRGHSGGRRSSASRGRRSPPAADDLASGISGGLAAGAGDGDVSGVRPSRQRLVLSSGGGVSRGGGATVGSGARGVGAQGRLCLAPALGANGFCGSQLHKSKVEIEASSGTVFCIPIKGTSGPNSKKTALSSPILYEHHMSESSLEILLTQKKSTAAWLHYFSFDVVWKGDDESSYQESIHSTTSPELSFDESVVEGRNESGEPPLSVVLSHHSSENVDGLSLGGGSDATLRKSLNLVKRLEADFKAMDVPGLRTEITSKISDLRDDLGALISLPAHPDGERFTSIVDSLEYVLITLVDLKVQRDTDMAWVKRSLGDVNNAITKACVETSSALKRYIGQELRTASSLPPRTSGGAGTVNVDTPLFGLSRSDPKTLRDLVSCFKKLDSDLSTLQVEHTTQLASLQDRLAATEADLAASRLEAADLRLTVKAQVSGMGSLEHSFTSKKDIATALRMEGLENFVNLSAFVDATNFLLHGQSEDTTTSEMLTSYKDLQKSNYSYLSFCFIHGCQQRMVPAYTGKATQYDSDKPIAIFVSKDHWSGKNASGGQKRILKKLITNSAKKAKSHIINNLPAGDFRDLALEMVGLSKDFHESIITYFEDEYTVLTQKEFKSKDVHQFLSDQFATMFEAFYDIRHHAYATSESVDTLERLADFIWITIQCHDKMAEFIRDGFQNHHLMQSALNRFSALHAGLKPSDVVSKADLESLRKELKKDTKMATERAEIAVVRADKAVDTLGKKK
ncbi:hypothetical protein ACHAWT_000884 [Skeletonema menzelii]